MKIVLVTSSMSSGGAERVMSILANYWVNHGKNIALITMDSVENDFYTLDPQVIRRGLGLISDSDSIWMAVRKNITRIRYLRMLIKEQQPNVVISFINRMNIITLLSVWDSRVGVVISERTDPTQRSIGPIWGLLRRFFYRKADAIVVQTTAVQDWTLKFVSKKRVHIIPNPVLPTVAESKLSGCSLSFPRPFVVSMGRLVPLKGFEMLLEAFALSSHNREEWSLVILGEGPQHKDLIKLSRLLGIESRVHFPGRIHEPNAILNQADIFVLSSKYEGFPNALLEAMSCSLPVISFDCPSGPGEIIRNGENGLLIPAEDVRGMAAAIRHLMGSKYERQKLASHATEVVEKYSIDKIMMQWDRLLGDIVGRAENSEFIKKNGYI